MFVVGLVSLIIWCTYSLLLIHSDRYFTLALKVQWPQCLEMNLDNVQKFPPVPNILEQNTNNMHKVHVG